MLHFITLGVMLWIRIIVMVSHQFWHKLTQLDRRFFVSKDTKFLIRLPVELAN